MVVVVVVVVSSSVTPVSMPVSRRRVPARHDTCGRGDPGWKVIIT